MIKRILFLSLFGVANVADAASPPGDPQIYRLAGAKTGQVVMLSNWPEGKVFSEYEDYRKDTGKFFSPDQKVWVMCQGRFEENQIKSIEKLATGMELTTLKLKNTPNCQSKPILMSNHEFPEQDWNLSQPSPTESQAIQRKLRNLPNIKVQKITTASKGAFFLVFDPSIPSIYDMGGHRLMDKDLKEIAYVEAGPLTPLIDLDSDGVPEFFVPDSDGMGASLCRLYPKVERELSHYYEKKR
jgi:hypothetical protein